MNVCFGKGSIIGLNVGRCPHADLCTKTIGFTGPKYDGGITGTVGGPIDYVANLLGIGPLICKRYEELEKLMEEKAKSDAKEWAGKEMKKLVPYFNENKII